MRKIMLMLSKKTLKRTLANSTTGHTGPMATSIMLCREKARKGEDIFTEDEVITILLDISKALSKLSGMIRNMNKELAQGML